MFPAISAQSALASRLTGKNFFLKKVFNLTYVPGEKKILTFHQGMTKLEVISANHTHFALVSAKIGRNYIFGKKFIFQSSFHEKKIF